MQFQFPDSFVNKIEAKKNWLTYKFTLSIWYPTKAIFPKNCLTRHLKLFWLAWIRLLICDLQDYRRALKNSIISALQIHGKSVLRLPQYACFRIQLSLFFSWRNFPYRNNEENPTALRRWRFVNASLAPNQNRHANDRAVTKTILLERRKNPTQICIFERVWRCEDNPRLISFHLRKLFWRKCPNCHNKYKSCTFKCNRCTCLERRESTQIDQKIFWGCIKLSQNSSLRFYILNTVNFYDLNFSF